MAAVEKRDSLDELNGGGNAESATSDAGGADESNFATIPKKRGRPSNPDKVKKIPSGRGRGRPAKNAAKLQAIKENTDGGALNGRNAADDDDDDDDDDDEAAAAANAGDDEVKIASRGRPPKAGKKKITEAIVATGKGRGRPKKTAKSDSSGHSASSDDSSSTENDEDNARATASASAAAVNVKKNKKTKGETPKKLGRPKKKPASDEEDEDDDDDYERRPFGRPATGAVNLNIVRTGRGQGRPKKTSAVAGKRTAADKNGDTAGSGDEGEPAKKIGRPALGKPKKGPSGKPRGRPRKNDGPKSSNATDDDDGGKTAKNTETKDAQQSEDDVEMVDDDENYEDAE